MSPVERKLRVCVIGAGAAGLCALRHFTSDPATFEPAAYEQTNHLGGTWVYSEEVGTDVHSSMYENLRTNLPSEIMNFPDWRKMGGESTSCITHAQVLSYLEDYADEFDLRKYITFNSKIEAVRADDRTSLALSTTSSLNSTIWKVKIKNTACQTVEEKEFDAVVCCNGYAANGIMSTIRVSSRHFFEPNIPPIPGLETFPGLVLHSHDYRKPQSFAGKTVVILGASSSGEDIGIELTGYARHVYLSHNKPRIISTLPVNLTQVMGVSGVEGNKFLFKDGSSAMADAFMYCTGYNYSFPFLDESCKISVDDNYIHPLYKHLINVEYPTMCFIGIPASVIPFPMFHIQVKYFIALLKGKASLPPKGIMLEDAMYKTPRRKHAHRLADNQWDYNDTLARDGHFEPLPPVYRAGYTAWKVQRSRNLWHYKQAKFLVADDGESVQIIPNNGDKMLP